MGRTHKYFITRLNEHLETDKASSIYKHLKANKNCKSKNNHGSFSILDNANTDYELGNVHYKWENPTLNGQKKHEIMRLMI